MPDLSEARLAFCVFVFACTGCNHQRIGPCSPDPADYLQRQSAFQFQDHLQVNVERAILRGQDGELYEASVHDRNASRQTFAANWGRIRLFANVAGAGLQLRIHVENIGHDAIESLQLRIMDVVTDGPAVPRNLMFKTPWMRKPAADRMAHGIGEPGVVALETDNAVLVVCHDDVDRPLAVGFGSPHDNDRTSWPMLAYTGRHPDVPHMFPYIHRPVPPRGSDVWNISIRLQSHRQNPAELADDIFKKFADAHPQQLKWPDRGPIGQIFLCRSASAWKTNPRGYFNTPKVDVTTEEGRATFRDRLLDYADRCVAIMSEMDAQGVIVWDIEGQEYKHPISYLGDPRSLPPEMEPVADAFMTKFTDAGFRVGLTIRPQVPVRRPYDGSVFQQKVENPVQNLIDKISYAKKRWGCSLFYLDSDVYTEVDPRLPGQGKTQSLLLGADVLRQVTEVHNDVLIVPEVEDLQNYAYGAPYLQLNYDKLPSTPPEVLRAYPDAFGVIVAVDSHLDEVRDEVVAAVRRGDILFYRTWFGDSWNKKIKAIYEDARK